MPDDQRRSRTSDTLRVDVLGGLRVTRDGTDVTGLLGPDARRLLGYLAVHARPQPVAGLAAAPSWLALAETLAEPVVGTFVAAAEPAGTVALAEGVAVDLVEALTLVRGMGTVPATGPYAREGIEPLCHDVLPGWGAGWVAVERERYRQIRLHALETLSARLSAAGAYADAVAVGRLAVRGAPSRESARRVLIEAHLTEGDIAAAIAEYEEFQELLRSSVGGPSPSGLDGLFPPSPAWPVLQVRRPVRRSPGLPVRRPAGSRRLVAGGPARSGHLR